MSDEHLPEGGDVEDRDAVDLAEAQEIGVGTDHAVSAARDRALEELVVGRIATQAEDDIGLDEPGPAPEADQHGASFPWGHAELAQDVGPRGDAVDLRQNRLGDEEDELVGAPGLVDACGEALGAGKGAPQEDLRVKNDRERGQRRRPRR